MTLTLQSVSSILHKPSCVENSDSKEDLHAKLHSPCLLSYKVADDTDIVPSDNFLPVVKSSMMPQTQSKPLQANLYSSYPQPALSSRPTSFLHPILNQHFMKSSKENYINPIFDAKFQQVILPVECGRNQAYMYLNKLCQGSKGPCILFKTSYWLTPNEFQFISGRETAKDWKRSIRHNGKSIKLLINKGILCVHSPLCECGSATASSMKMGKLPFYSNECKFNSNYSSVYENSEDNTGSEDIGTASDTLGNGATWDNSLLRSKRSSQGDLDSIETGTEGSGSSPRSGDWNMTQTSHCLVLPPTSLSSTSQDLDGFRKGVNDDLMMLSVNVGSERGNSPLSRSSDILSISNLTATESQSEETSITGVNMNNNDSPTPPTKSKRKNKAVAVKSERQSPQLSSSTTSPPMTPPPPPNNPPGQGSSPPPQPIKQMEQMMGSGRNYSDFMRSLAAKYNQQANVNTDYYSRSSPANFAFDTRFLKPAAAAALLNLSCSQIPSNLFGSGGNDKDKFPMIDMSSTQTLLSMVRSASAAAANNLESLKSSGSQHQKRPNSPLDLSSRDMPSTPPHKKSKPRSAPMDVAQKIQAPTPTPTLTCLSSCSTGCTEEAQMMINWSVEEVCRFVTTIDLCKDYVEVFRDHAIDGSSLPLLTEEHLMNAMNMKLGPALKFRSTVARKLGTCAVCSHCTHCHTHNNNNGSSSP